MMLKQGDMLVVDYVREFLQLSKFALELVSTEGEINKQLLQRLWDEFWVQLVSYKRKEFVDLNEQVKMVEQLMSLDKKIELLKNS